jgi:DNA-binding response OmpR family regulator
LGWIGEMKIILLSDDKVLGHEIYTALISKYFILDTINTVFELKDYLERFPYDLIIIDASLKHLDVFSFAKELQSVKHPIMLLLLFPEMTTQVEIASLNAGADDCLARSCSEDELIAHVRALLRRKGEKYPVIGRWGDFVVDCGAQTVSYGDQVIPLTPKEYQLITLFLSAPRQTFGSQLIIDSVWSSMLDQPSPETVKTHIRSLRVKLHDVGLQDLIQTIYGFGYRLNSELLTRLSD